MIMERSAKEILDEVKDKEQFDADWKRYGEEMTKYHAEVERMNKRITKAIVSFKGKAFMNDVLKCMEESEADDRPWILVREPLGDYQEEDHRSFKGVWVDQHSTGTEGDTWEGYVSILLKRGLWLKFYFTM